MQGLRDSIKAKVICVIQAWKDEKAPAYDERNTDGHYVALVGYGQEPDGEYVYYFMDPSTPAIYTYMYETDFINRWHDEYKDEEGNVEILRISITINYLKRLEDSDNTFYYLG